MSKIYNFINRLLITGLITVIVLICVKKNNNFKSYLTNEIMGVNFNFAYLNEIYNKYFGSNIPFKDLFDDNTQTVFNEKLEYNSKESYLDGVKLSVTSDYFVPSLNSGVVVFIGYKEGYGNVVIVNETNGIDVWYGNLFNIGVDLYQYVSSGSLIGNANDELYLVFKKDGKIVNYEDYI